jgi:hypothetical protein
MTGKARGDREDRRWPGSVEEVIPGWIVEEEEQKA